MALDLYQNFVSRFYLEHLLTNFLQTLYKSSYQEGVVLGLKMSKFCQLSTDLWSFIYVTILLLHGLLS